MVHWPFFFYFLLVVLMSGGIIGISYFLGQRHRQRATGEPFESGMKITGSARLRLNADFYLVAILFVVFDLESVFIFSWSAAVRELGWTGFAEVSVFIGILVCALVYLWRIGVFEFGSRGRPRRVAPTLGRGMPRPCAEGNLRE